MPVDGQNVLVGFGFFGGVDRQCRATAGYWRLDTPWEQEFLSQFVTLP